MGMDVDVWIDVWDQLVACGGVRGWSGFYVTGCFRDDGWLVFWDVVLVCEEDVESGRVSPIHQRLRSSSCRSSLAVDGVWGRGVEMVASWVLFACASIVLLHFV